MRLVSKKGFISEKRVVPSAVLLIGAAYAAVVAFISSEHVASISL